MNRCMLRLSTGKRINLEIVILIKVTILLRFISNMRAAGHMKKRPEETAGNKVGFVICLVALFLYFLM